MCCSCAIRKKSLGKLEEKISCLIVPFNGEEAACIATAKVTSTTKVAYQDAISLKKLASLDKRQAQPFEMRNNFFR